MMTTAQTFWIVVPPTSTSLSGPGGQPTNKGLDLADFIISFVTLGSAIIGAILGSWITVLSQRRAETSAAERTFSELRRYLISELTIIFHESTLRATVDRLELYLRPPLPTTAWQAMNYSGYANRLGATNLTRLADLYRDVESANFQSAQVTILLQTSSLAAEQEVKTAFREEAQRLSSEPFTLVAAQREDISRLLSEDFSASGTSPS